MKEELLEKLVKLQDDYIKVIAKSESNFAIFCNSHGISVDRDLARQAAELREQISLIKLEINQL